MENLVSWNMGVVLLFALGFSKLIGYTKVKMSDVVNRQHTKQERALLPGVTIKITLLVNILAIYLF